MISEEIFLHGEMLPYYERAMELYEDEEAAVTGIIAAVALLIASEENPEDEDDARDSLYELLLEQEQSFEQMLQDDPTVDPEDTLILTINAEGMAEKSLQILSGAFDGSLSIVFQKGLFLLCAIEEIISENNEATLRICEESQLLREIFSPSSDPSPQYLH